MKHVEEQENASGVLGRSCRLCSLSKKSFSNKKYMEYNSTRSMEWSQAKHLSPPSLTLFACETHLQDEVLLFVPLEKPSDEVASAGGLKGGGLSGLGLLV